MAAKVHPSRKAVEGPSSMRSLASSLAAADLPSLPREDAVLLAGDDDRDVVGPAGFQSYVRHTRTEDP